MKKCIMLGMFLVSYYFGTTQIISRQNELPQPIVNILATEPEQPIEGGRVVVYFRFTNRLETTLNGWIGAEMNSGTSAPKRSRIDWPVINLEKGQSIDGAIMVSTTDAGVGKKLKVFFYENQETRSDNAIVKSLPKYVAGEKDMNIAAIVNFRLKSFTINHTRAQTTDTDWGSLYAVVDDVPVMDPISIYMGDFKDGTYPFKGTNIDREMVDVVETGPIALVPGQNSSLYIAYTMYNGGGIDDGKSFLKGYAEATANPIMFHGPRPGTSDGFKALKVINPFFNAIGACDGFVVMDTLTINTNGIFSNTINGNKDFTKRYNSEEYSSQTGCGNTSDYEVNSSINRMSLSSYSSLYDGSVYTKVTSNRTINPNGNKEMEKILMSAYDIKWHRVETIDWSGKFIEKNDGDYGYVDNNIYHSPQQITKPLLVILRGSMIERFPDPANQSLSILNNGPLKQAVAIIQLIPGITITEAKTNYTPPTEQKEEKTGEDYGHQDPAKGKLEVIRNFAKPITVSGEWRFKITSSGGAVFTGVVNLQQNGDQVSGNLNVTDNTKSAVAGSYSNGILNLMRDTGLETKQYYKLTKVNDTYFSGTYENRGKYPDSGTVEFFK